MQEVEAEKWAEERGWGAASSSLRRERETEGGTKGGSENGSKEKEKEEKTGSCKKRAIATKSLVWLYRHAS